MSNMSGLPFRADHAGSVLRPPELLRARAEHQAGRLSAEELRRVEDQAIRDVVRMQQEIGLEAVTDGEFRRGSWHMDFLYQIGGWRRPTRHCTSSSGTRRGRSRRHSARFASAAS